MLAGMIDNGICAGDPPSRKAVAWQASSKRERGDAGERKKIRIRK
jgi:hypothetical protein